MIQTPFSVAVFPFLKTSGPVRIGTHTFRSTTDVADLSLEHSKAVGEIAQMLFVQGDLRVKSASYAIIPFLEARGSDEQLSQLQQLRSVISYIYAAPHEVFENVFLSPEEVSLVLFTPGPVSVFLARPEHHTQSVAPLAGPAPNTRHEISGYRGLYNFRHHFWIEPGSRLYGPKPHMTLNIEQDLQTDLEYHILRRTDYRLLLALLGTPRVPSAQRIFSALHWFNASNESELDPDRALLNLAVAFEALLRLPDSAKTERLVDAIALLLGRTERLDDWAAQFYAARSRIAHEGRLQDPYFYIAEGNSQKPRSGLFGSLMLYGRQIFQLCLGTLLVGMDLAERADLQEKFVTNNERFQKLCQLLDTQTGTPGQRLLSLQPTLRALQRYRFVPSGAVAMVALIGAVRHAAAALIECRQPLDAELADALTKSASSKRADSDLAQLAAIEQLAGAFRVPDTAAITPEVGIVRDLVDIAWTALFQHYYWLKERVQP